MAKTKSQKWDTGLAQVELNDRMSGLFAMDLHGTEFPHITLQIR